MEQLVTPLSIKCALIFASIVLLATPSVAEISPFAKDQKAAQLGNPDAQFKLGLAYQMGDGVSQDDAKAAIWFRRAACNGNMQAQVKLIEAYYLGRGVPQDYFLAGWWMLKVAVRKSAVAEAQAKKLKMEAANGYVAAKEQLRKANAKFMQLIDAAEKGNAKAQSQVGIAYSIGRDVPKDEKTAVEWFRRSAEQGNPDGQSLLAIAYAEGAGVPKDNVEAIKWLTILMAQTKEPLRKVFKATEAMISKSMSQDQIRDARMRAKRWLRASSEKH